MRKLLYGLIAVLGLGACSPPDGGNAAEKGATDAAGQIGQAQACASALQAEPDRESFAEWTEGVAGSSEDLIVFAARAGDAFKAAAEDMCRSGSLEAGRLAPFRRLLVQNGSGATETAIYTDPGSLGEETLVFQWIFVEDGWALPERADIEEGIACWADPSRPVCAERRP